MELRQEIDQAPAGPRFTNCQRCKRSLRNPKAMEIGYGKVCLAKSGGRRQLQPELPKDESRMTLSPLGLRLGIVAFFRDRRLISNVPWRAICHSPDGYAWGYGGSGPTDFSLNIAEAVLREIGYRGKREKVKPGPDGDGKVFRLAFTLGDQVKREIVCQLDQDGPVSIGFEKVRKMALDLATREAVNGIDAL